MNPDLSAATNPQLGSVLLNSGSIDSGLDSMPLQASQAAPPLADALAQAARHLSVGAGWRETMPQVLADMARATDCSRVAWFELEQVSPSQHEGSSAAWTASLRTEWRASQSISTLFAREIHGLDSGASGLAEGRIQSVQEEPGAPSVLLPVLVRGELRAVLLAQGEVVNEVWQGLSCLISGALEREILQSERRALEEEHLKSEHLLRALLDNTGDVLCAISVGGTISYASPSLERTLAWAEPGPVGACLWDVVHQDDRVRVRAQIRHIARARPQVLEAGDSASHWEMRLRHHDGSWHTFEVGCRSLLHDPVVKALILNARDVSEHKAVESGLLQAALHDRLTGLPNRALFMDRLHARVEQSKRERFKPQVLGADSAQLSAEEGEAMFAVLFLDFDRFKVINDSLGHMVGDELLKAGARRIETCLRPGDTAARLGGDEFAILLHEIGSQNDAVQVAERIQKALSKSFLLSREEERNTQGQAQQSTHEVFIAASVGIALGGSAPRATPYQNAGDALRDADMAMYRAKEKGRARHEIFSSHMHEQAVERLQLETDLRRSLEDGDFRVHYQPIIALDTGLLSGFEALVRWHHPRRGMVAPEGFLAVAEETGLIAPLGWWVLRHACAQLRAWMDEMKWEGERPLHELTINVNLSSRQFASEELPSRVRQVLEDSGLKPRNLKLEITEATLITQSSVAARQLQALHEIGVQLGLDDFGTGYSSLAYLHRFPIDSLKIDRSFISHLDSQHNAGIVATIIALARQLNLNVVAEGVETPEQAGRLREMQCPMGQGFYFSQPMPHEAAAVFMNSGASGPILEA